MYKKYAFIVIFILTINSLSAFELTFDLNLTATMLRSNGVWKKNTQVNIVKFVHDTNIDEYGRLNEFFYLEDEKGNSVDINSKVDDCFGFKYNNVQQLWDANIVTKVLYQLKKKGFQYELRREMEDDALKYIHEVKSSGLELNDPFLNTYVYSLIARIAPVQLIDGRPGSVNIIIQQNPSINACCFPNGTIVLNTGLLALLHSEDELVAILAHEIAHFILDHAVQNVNAAISRQKRAAFWGKLATGLTAVAEGVVASRNEYYVPGAATIGMAVLSTSIAKQVVDRLGMQYNHEQEQEADRLAIEVLEILGYDKNALATALNRINEEKIKDMNNVAYLDSYTHPALIKRIQDAGVAYTIRDKHFERHISFAISNVALMKYNDCRFRQCLPYVDQNIENGVATVDDYILKANCYLNTRNDLKSNNDVMELIKKAKSLDSRNINVLKSEIIATMRLDDKIKSIELLKQYISSLEEGFESNLTDVVHQRFVFSEKEWAKKMIIKLNGMLTIYKYEIP